MLTGAASYVADIDLANAAHVTYVRSTMAHARVVDIDVSGALTSEGVLAVVTAANIGEVVAPQNPMIPGTLQRPLLADGVVRFVGEPIVGIVAETPYLAADAAESVIIDYDPLPAVVDLATAAESDVTLFPEHGSNVLYDSPLPDPSGFADCEVVASEVVANTRIAACPIEPRVSAAYWNDDGRLVQYLACQGAHGARTTYAEAYGLEPDQVRVIVPDVGGSFGTKSGPFPEDILLGELSRRIDRPVCWAETRSEGQQAMGHGRGQIQTVTIGGTKEGRITNYQLDIIQDAGAYPAIGALLPIFTKFMATGCYDIETVECSSYSVVTNTAPTVALRGAGRPEATAAIERAVDLFAAEAGLDPVEVRRINFIANDAFPLELSGAITYDSGDYGGALDQLLEASDYAGLRAEQLQRRNNGDRSALGLGLASYVEITAPIGHRAEYGAVELQADGRFRARTGTTPYGQGHQTTWAMIVADRLGVDLDRIDVIHGDTDAVPQGEGTGGSRSVQLAGSAMVDASDKLIELAKARASDLLEAAVEDIVFDAGDADGRANTGAFSVAGTPAVSVSWDDVAAAPPSESEHRVGQTGNEASEANDGAEASADGTSDNRSDNHSGERSDDVLLLEGISDFVQPNATFPFGAHLAVVEVDLDTGKAELVRLIAVDDAGVIINPALAEGQRHGGLAAGAAQALMEESAYDADGNPITSNFADYAVISAMELPSFELLSRETPTPLNPLGAKGIGEAGTIGATPAVQNAVIDALAPLGIRHIDMPTTPEKVWRAVQAAEAN